MEYKKYCERKIMEKIKKNFGVKFILFCSCCLCCFTILLCLSSEAANHVVINEVCSKNFSVIYDENGNYSDYVELYNPSIVPISLTGFSLSDSKDDLAKCVLDTVIIRGKGHILIWLDGSDGSVVGHASFKISSQGEEIYLSNQNGRIIDSIRVPKLEYNTVFARIRDGGEEWGRQTPTAEENNDNSEAILPIELDSPSFSVESGFYKEDFLLRLSAKENEVIFYTLDGSEPTLASQKYTEPIMVYDASKNENVYANRTDLSTNMNYVPDFKVDKGTVVRAMAFSPLDRTVSKTVTAIYFVGLDLEEYESCAVLSLVTDPKNLFDEKVGIYGNGEAFQKYIEMAGNQNGIVPDEYIDSYGDTYYKYMSTNAFKRGREWEREANIIFFDETYTKKMEQSVGIRIAGESSRNAAQKSFNLYARDIYDGNETITCDFFENRKYSSVKIRNGGSDYAGSKIYDPFLHSLVKDRDVSVQDSRECAVFLNGEYWGNYNIRERYKEDYFLNHYGISEDNIWMLDAGRPSLGGEWDAWNCYDAVLRFISEYDMGCAENYELATELIDIQSLIDFYCIQLYIDNNDIGFDKNIAIWRSKQKGDGEYEDGRWRFMLLDLDGALGSPDHNTFEESEGWKEDFNLMDEEIVKNLLKSPEFQARFVETFEEIADSNFHYEDVHEKLMQWQNCYQVQSVKSHQRFISEDIGTKDYEEYISYIDDFFKTRRQYIMEYLREEMNTWQ